jgi:pimeloyl-ACP methyl ester carboxylesterase
MRQLVIALVVALTGAYAWAQGNFVEGHAQGDGLRLYFMQAGAGPLIVFLHGAPDDWTLYDAQLREFRRDHLAVAPNLRGFPPSEALHCLGLRLGVPGPGRAPHYPQRAPSRDSSPQRTHQPGAKSGLAA